MRRTHRVAGGIMKGTPTRINDCPVVNVIWFDAWAYCLWLGDRYRLPMEREWEFAWRAGTKSRSMGGDRDEWKNYAWYYKNSDKRTHPVGKKLLNRFGLCDMDGNVWEWCSSWKAADPDDGDDPWYSGYNRVTRGGAWNRYGRTPREADRMGLPPMNSSIGIDFGFRVARAHHRKS